MYVCRTSTCFPRTIIGQNSQLKYEKSLLSFFNCSLLVRTKASNKLIVAATVNAATADVKEAEVKILDDHTALRAGNPPTTTVDTLVESLPDADSCISTLVVGPPSAYHHDVAEFTSTWTLGQQALLAIQSGAGIVFTHPATKIHHGNVCAYSAVTGLEGIEYKLLGTHGGSGLLVTPALHTNAKRRRS